MHGQLIIRKIEIKDIWKILNNGNEKNGKIIMKEEKSLKENSEKWRRNVEIVKTGMNTYAYSDTYVHLCQCIYKSINMSLKVHICLLCIKTYIQIYKCIKNHKYIYVYTYVWTYMRKLL
jgi:hypothetical protein